MKYATLILIAAALTGCPVITSNETRTTTTIDVPGTIALLDAAMQRRVNLTNQAVQWGRERDALAEQLAVVNALPKSSSGGVDPRITQLSTQIREKSELIANNLALLNADDAVATMLIKSAIAEFKAGEGVTLTFVPAPAPTSSTSESSTRPGAIEVGP